MYFTSIESCIVLHKPQSCILYITILLSTSTRLIPPLIVAELFLKVIVPRMLIMQLKLTLKDTKLHISPIREDIGDNDNLLACFSFSITVIAGGQWSIISLGEQSNCIHPLLVCDHLDNVTLGQHRLGFLGVSLSLLLELSCSIVSYLALKLSPTDGSNKTLGLLISRCIIGFGFHRWR